MALHDRIRKLTYDDYVLIPEDGQRHEIIDGEHYVSPAPVPRHQIVGLRLKTRLFPFVQDRGLGQVLDAPTDVLFSRFDVVQPDLLYISNERAEILTEKNVQGAPDLVVEILSPSTRDNDEGIKLDLYERSGVLEYWIFDPVLKKAQVYRRVGDRLQIVANLSAEGEDVLTTPLLPALELPMTEIFG
ncbi:MAG: Uma2 family endonuclease [Thermoanaerobaculia bacterium]